MPPARLAGKEKIIAVLGAGFGGLRAATLIDRGLRRKRIPGYRVALIDRNEYHTYTPLLYETATISKETANICEIREIVAYRFARLLLGTKIKFIQAEVKNIDPLAGSVSFTDGPPEEIKKLEVEYLVIALGAEPNYFDIPGLKNHALPFKSMLDAVRIRDAITTLAMEKPGVLRVAVGGGGSTGIELAGELKVWAGELDKSHHSRLEVDLVQAAPTILPGFSPKVIRLAKLRLRRLGVRLMENERITSVGERDLQTASGRTIPFDIFIWTGGIKPSAIIKNLPLKTDPRGWLEVGGDMACLPKSPDVKFGTRIYGIGDNISAYYPGTKQPVPGVARAALSQAEIAAKNIVSEIEAEEGYLPAPRRQNGPRGLRILPREGVFLARRPRPLLRAPGRAGRPPLDRVGR
ncbi:MAG: FAD-dependent oxidoreductase, partial [Patescibacteria group bacterium]